MKSCRSRLRLTWTGSRASFISTTGRNPTEIVCGMIPGTWVFVSLLTWKVKDFELTWSHFGPVHSGTSSRIWSLCSPPTWLRYRKYRCHNSNKELILLPVLLLERWPCMCDFRLRQLGAPRARGTVKPEERLRLLVWEEKEMLKWPSYFWWCWFWR